MANSTYTLDAALLNATLTGNTYTGNTTVYLALYTTTPTANTAGTELSGNGYSRQSVAFSVANSVATSTANVTFTASGGNWSGIVGGGIVDATTGGNLLYFATLPSIKNVTSGNTLTFTSGNVKVNLGP